MLTKSLFKQFLDHPLHFWAVAHGAITVYPDPGTRFIMSQGYQVEEVAIRYLRTLLTTPDLDLKPQHTISQGRLKARVDLWVETLMSQAASIYEIKSATRLKQDHIWDLAFQYHIAATLRDIGKTFLVHVNPAYRLVGELDPSQFFIIEDVTDQVTAKQVDLPELIRQALHILDSPERPDLPGCGHPHDCPCPDVCFGGQLKPTSIHYLHGTLPDSLKDIADLTDITDPSDLNPKQQKQVESAKSGQPIIDRPAIATFLDRLRFPLYFLDYETINFAIPKYQHHAPQSHLPFQYSLHRLDAPDAPLTHFEFLETGRADPSPTLLKQLSSQIGDTGSILVWYKNFEQGRNRYLAELAPDYRDFINGLNNRIVDLMDPFARGWYADYRFRGSASIKRVLPILIPDLSYKDLSIGNGGLALVSWYKMVYENVSAKERRKIQQDLLEYCQLDTRAMVTIYRFLTKP